MADRTVGPVRRDGGEGNSDDAATVATELAPLAKRTMVLPLWVVSLIGAFFLALFIREAATNAVAGSTKIAVVDMGRIIQAKSASVAAKPATDIAADAEAFTGQLHSALDRLTDDGYVVVNSAHLAAWPKALEVTEDIAGRLNVNLSVADLAAKDRANRVNDLLDKSRQTAK